MAIANPEGPSVVYGSSSHGNQQQRIASSTDVNNNEVTISTTGTFFKIILTVSVPSVAKGKIQQKSPNFVLSNFGSK